MEVTELSLSFYIARRCRQLVAEDASIERFQELMALREQFFPTDKKSSSMQEGLSHPAAQSESPERGGSGGQKGAAQF